ncbi:MAG: hypothetical protein QG656_483, partial [Candidatus Hydrogenedentes bacterium]|nr:hypothetical protein [Candidatus Hydrogenedentota bacterium]
MLREFGIPEREAWLRANKAGAWLQQSKEPDPLEEDGRYRPRISPVPVL